MPRKGSGTVIVLLKKRTVCLACAAILIALVCIVSAAVFRRDKQAVSNRELMTSPVLILDAGHGGEDGGAVSAAGVPESDINLQIVQKLELLFAFTGQTTRLTRSSQDAVYSPDAQTLREKKVSDLKNRVDLVNSVSGSILISIHQNSLPGSRVRGAQVFYNAIEPAQSTAISVQQSLNSAINPNNEKNAKQIDGSIYLMKNIQRPGILVECGFMSNAAEAEQLQTDTHQRRLSAAIVSGYLQSREGKKQG